MKSLRTAHRRVLRARLLLLSMTVLLFGCDHATKFAATRHLEGKSPVSLIPGLLELRMAHNEDIAFSVLGRLHLAPSPIVLALLASVIAIGVAVFWWRKRGMESTLLEQAGYASVLAGALGNVVDRLARGYVVDFIHVRAWPVFNVADIAVVLGAMLILFSGLRDGGRRGPSEEPRLPSTP